MTQFIEAIALTFTAVAVSNGFGRHSIYLTPDNIEAIGVDFFVVIMVSLWASCSARISVALLFLEFTPAISWRIVLWGIVCFQVALGIASDTVQLVQCRPVQAMWEPVEGAHCFTNDQIWANAYAFIGKSVPLRI